MQDLEVAEQMAKNFTAHIDVLSANYDMVLFGNECIQF